jgi:hypothetical protein
MRLFRFYWTWCMNSVYVYMSLDVWTLCIFIFCWTCCMLLDAYCVFFQKLYADCVVLQTECRLYFLSISDGWANINTSVVTVNSSSDEWMTSACPSLLGATAVVGVFYPSLLSYHCSDALVAMSRLPMAIMTYSPLLQCMFVVVCIYTLVVPV